MSLSRLVPGGATPGASSAFYDVVAYGVTMNSSTAASTNGTILNRLSTAVNTAGGGTIYIPAGTLWTTEWDITGTAIHVTGAGRGATTVKAQSAIPITLTNSTGCTISDLTIQTVSGTQVLYTTGNTRCTLSRVECVGGSTAGIFLDNSSLCVFDHLLVRDGGTAAKGVWAFKNLRRCAFSNITVDTVGAHGFILEAGSTDTGTSAAAPYDNTITNLRLINTCTNTQGSAIAIHGANGNVFSGVVIDTVGTGGQGIGFEEDQNAAQSDVGAGSENILTGVYMKDVGGYGISFTGSARNRVSNVSIHNINAAGGGTGIAILFQKGTGTDGVTPGDHDCLDNVVENVDIRQTSANAYTYAVQFIGDGSELIHRNRVTNLRPGSPATAVANWASSAVATGANANVVRLATAGGTVALTYSASITPNLADGSYFTLTVTNNSALTINAVTNALPGAVITLDILNSSGGSMGAITWNAVYKLAGAFTNPADTKRRTITFGYDGTNWVEQSRAAADI